VGSKEDNPISSSPITIGEHLALLLPRLSKVRQRHVPYWPADVFAVAMSLIQKSGIYTLILNEWPPTVEGDESPGEWAEKMKRRGERWRGYAGADEPRVPTPVSNHWRLLMHAFSSSLDRLREDRSLAHALFELAAMADEASAGVGLPRSPSGASRFGKFYRRARTQLLPTEKNGSTLCMEIDRTRLRVLPKMHAPSKGLTIRSLSHHLALCSGDEICPFWEISVGYSPIREFMNLLIVPWPETIKPVQFERVPRKHSGMRNMPNDFGFFQYSPEPEKSDNDNVAPERFVAHVEELYREAISMMGRIDGIVFPELALVPEEFEALREAEFTQKLFLVSGIAKAPDEDSSFSANELYCDIPNRERMVQSKHHRWKLDKSQIIQYGLGSLLSPERSWWEHINVDNRKLNFVSLLPWLVMSVVICEDLARPDPVGDLLRAVGPNLVLALLMDGPQIKERWSARYATTLAEDPGCSVLSLTSAGMSKLSRPASGVNRSKVIGLWKDAHSSAPVEIELPDGCGGVVLSMSVRWMDEWTADGREDRGATGYPLLSGIHGVKKTSNPV
jgi:hypothetical protein